jgi:dTDP-glucose pyrophosphorylase
MIRLSNLAAYLCPTRLRVRDAVERLNATEHLFQLVIAPDGRLVGTVTDGDVRRAMLSGVSLDAPVDACMKRSPVSGRAGEEARNIEKLRRIGGFKAFLPVLDAEDGVVEVLAIGAPEVSVLTALVMAGGPGTRLGERTKNRPKPLLPVGERPILDQVLASLEQAGVTRIFVSVHYLADQIESFIANRSNRAEIGFVRENERRGTIGALALLPKSEIGPTLVVNGDLVTDVDWRAFSAFHTRHGFDATIGVARYEVDIPFGVVRHGPDGLFEGIDEKPRLSHFVAGGLYILGSAFAGLVPRNRAMDMPELLNQGRALGLSIGLFPIHEYWKDIGRPHDLESAESERGR